MQGRSAAAPQSTVKPSPAGAAGAERIETRRGAGSNTAGARSIAGIAVCAFIGGAKEVVG